MSIISSTIPSILANADAINPDRKSKLLFFIGEEGHPDLGQLVKELSQAGHSFFGGIFPGIISGLQKNTQGTLIIPLPEDTQLSVIDDLSAGLSFDSLDLEFSSSRSQQHTALIFIDGLSTHIASFLLNVHSQIGHRIDFFGGGAGYLSLEQKPCLFSEKGVFMDGALIAILPKSINLGVRHGWKKIIGPLVATKTRKNVILELNWENAFEVYQKAVENDSGQFFDEDNFFELAKGYPFGLLQEGEEDIVRDPIKVVDGGGLFCVGDVPENSVLHILKGEPDSLISSAALATQDSLKGLGEKPVKALLVDCISRVLFLEEDFQKELDAVQQALQSQDDFSVQGILSLGEISTYGEGFLEFFNKTIVVGLLED